MCASSLFVAFIIFNIHIPEASSDFEILPSRGEVLIFDENYIKEAHFEFHQYGFREKKYVNAIINIRHAWGNNVSLHASFFENHNNEFSRSAYEMKYKFCTFLLKDPMAGRIVRTALNHVQCPLSPGLYKLMNMTDVIADYPYEWPFLEGRALINIFLTETKANIFTSYVDFRINDYALAPKSGGITFDGDLR